VSEETPAEIVRSVGEPVVGRGWMVTRQLTPSARPSATRVMIAGRAIICAIQAKRSDENDTKQGETPLRQGVSMIDGRRPHSNRPSRG